MACEALETWSLSGLLAAFLDLAIAYSLLCASAVAFLGFKFLGFFGLQLPCPCDWVGIFSNVWSKSFCLNRLFIEFPTRIVSHVFLSVKEHFPFHDSSMARGGGNYSTTVGEICMSEVVEMEGGEASCSSLSDARKLDVIKIRELRARADKCDLKGKGVVGHRPRSRLRQRRKWSGTGGGLGKNSVAIDGASCSAHSRDNMVANGDRSDNLEYDDTASTTMGVMEREVAAADDYIFMNPKALLIEELQKDRHEVQTLNEDEKNAIRLLEQKLEEERIARAALYIELEKERSSAATAADEAMAMILRLQEDKACIKMEALQYQRILEEKSIYDAEEMAILKEILIRREKEKHFLEKEVQAYRQMVSTGDKQISNDDQVLIPHKLTAVVSIDKPSTKVAFANPSSLFNKLGDSDEQLCWMSDCSSSGNINLQEKQIISVNNNLPSSSKASQYCEKETSFEGKELEKVIVSCLGTDTGDQDSGPKGTSLGSSSNSSDSISDKYSLVHDVHIDGINFGSDANAADESKLLTSVNDSTEVHTTGFPTSTEFDEKKSNPEMTTHGSTETAADHEMLKIKSEVGWLQERLKFIQEGREKISLSEEIQERENLQLKLLEDVAHQVQEIRHLTETGKATRQVSLPLPTSKATSRKRRSRSVSISSEGKA